jgi:hypothetical protein
MGRLQLSAARASSAAARGNMRLAFIPLLYLNDASIMILDEIPEKKSDF